LITTKKAPICSARAVMPRMAIVMKTRSPATTPNAVATPFRSPMAVDWVTTSKTLELGIAAKAAMTKNRAMESVSVIVLPPRSLCSSDSLRFVRQGLGSTGGIFI